MKLFYFVDFIHVKKYGIPITFDRYVHLERGPVPSNILNLVNSVIDSPEEAELSDTISIKLENGGGLQKIQCKQLFTEKDSNYFTGRELETLEEVCKAFKDFSTKKIVEASHEESAWKNTNENTEISYTLAALDKNSNVSEEEISILLSTV